MAAAKRSYAGAKVTNSLWSWATSNLSANQEIYSSLERLRARSRDLCRNNDYAKKFLRMVRTNVVGPGIKLQSRVKDANGKPDRVANEMIESAWRQWGKVGVCEVSGRYSFTDVKNTVISQMAQDGEVLVRFVRGNGYKYGIALQLIEADHLDLSYNDPLRNIVMGIEFDEWGRPKAYHLFEKHPGERMGYVQNKRVRIPADEILHLFIPDRISQNRGVPWMHTAIVRMNMLYGYEEAELVASRLAAAKAGFYVAPPGDEYVGPKDEDGSFVQELEPGVFEVLPSGWDFKPYDPQHPTTAFKDFVKATLRGIASGLDVSYNYLANDLESVNYSSIRAGVLDEREVWKGLQKWMIEHFLTPVFEKWLEMALLTGELKLPVAKFEKFNAPSWQPRGWAWVDPLKDVQAAILAMQSGLKSATEIAAEQGKDIEDVYEQLAREKELRKKYGITTADDAKLLEAMAKIKNEGEEDEAQAAV